MVAEPDYCRFVPPIHPAEGKLSSRYGMRLGRVSGAPTYHAGMDFAIHPDIREAVVAGTRGYPTVFACRSGTVAAISRDEALVPGFRGYGNCVALRHDEQWRRHQPIWSFVAHLSEILVEPGARLAAGEPIGRIGNTSNGKFSGMGPHLHLELRRAKRDGSTPYPGRYRVHNLDPEPWLRSHGLRFDRRGYFVVDYERACD